MLGDMIKKRREQIGMSQDELAQKVGYKMNYSISIKNYLKSILFNLKWIKWRNLW